MRKIAMDRLDRLFAALSESAGRLYIPADTDAGAIWRLWEPGIALSEAVNTIRSPKDFFFPQTEDLMGFRFNGKKIGVTKFPGESEDFVIFGVRACDARAFAVLDNVFLADPADSYYQNRRNHALIVSLACARPAETCFCATFGVDAADPKEGDIVCHIAGGVLYLDARSGRGTAALDKLAECTEEADSAGLAAVADAKARIRENLAALPMAGLSAGAFGGGKTAEYFDRPEWAELSEACLGCGSCTFVCPTCQCYDIRDYDTGNGVRRYRCWDSCMYSQFTKMSAGQPRLTQLERFRQRFMHKLVYYPENNGGLFSCVGCGRCVIRCPIQMNIAKVMRTLQKPLKGGESRE